MSLEKVNIFISNKYGCTLEDLKEKGINHSFDGKKLDLTEYEKQISKAIDGIYNDLYNQKDDIKSILNIKDEENKELLDYRNSIHNKAVENCKKFAKEDAMNTIYGNTFLPNEFNRNAFSFVTNLAKDPEEIQEIANYIKSGNKEKLTEFFKDGVKRCKEALEESFKNTDDEKILDNAIKYNKEYKVLAEMQPGKIEKIAESLGIENEVKNDVNNWLNEYANVAVTSSLQRNYLNFFSSPMYADMGLDSMFKNVNMTDELMESDDYNEFTMDYEFDDAIKTFTSEKQAFKNAYGLNSIEQAQDEYKKSFDYLKKHNKKDKDNVILDSKGREIKDNQIGEYMASGNKIYVYDSNGNYVSSMKANKLNFGAFTYDSKSINAKQDKDILKGLNDLKNELMKHNPRRLDDPMKDYNKIIDKLDALTMVGLDKNKLGKSLNEINELASKYMSEHKKTKGITGIGDKRRNAVETVFNTCKRLGDDLGLNKNKEVNKTKEVTETRKNIVVEGAKTQEMNMAINNRTKDDVNKKISMNRSQVENTMANLMKANANKQRQNKKDIGSTSK